MGNIISCCADSGNNSFRNRSNKSCYNNDGHIPSFSDASLAFNNNSNNHVQHPRISITHNVAPYECIPPASTAMLQQSRIMSASQHSDSRQPLYNQLSTSGNNHNSFNTLDSKYSTIRPLDCQIYQFMDFPFLTSVAVIRWLMTTKILFVMRGPSGSGKSTIVDCLKDKYSSSVVCTRDNFFQRSTDGSLKWEKSRENEADNWHQNQVYQVLEAGRSPVIIDEPHVRCWEYKYPVELAGKFDYIVLTVLPKTPWRFEPEQLHEKSSRNEPLWDIERSINQFEPAIPLYFGWFLNDADSDDILQFSSDLLEIMMNIQEIRIGLAAACDLPEFVSKEDLIDHWTVKADRLHVTTKFCGYGTVADSETYLRSGAVQESLGQLFPVHVKGFLLTPRTFSGHVQLAGPKQIQLWAADDQEDCGLSTSGGGSRSGSLSKKTGLVAKLNSSKSNQRRPFGCRAHVTLMFAEGVRPVQSGLDQLQIIDLQLQNANSRCVAQIDAGNIIDWGHGRYYLELNQPIICQTLFTGQY